MPPTDITNLEQRIAILERQVEELSRAKEQQITYPLDDASIRVLNNYFMRITDAIVTFGGASGRAFVSFIGKQGEIPRVASDTNGVIFGNGISKFELPQIQLTEYVVDPTTDKFTLLEGRKMDSGEFMTFYTGDVGPGGITVGLGTPVYEADNVSGRTFTIKDTDGVAVNITSAGTGHQYLIRTDSNGV